MEYVNLYFKSEYSMFNSLCRIDESVKLAKEYGYKTLAIVDDGNLHGAVKFYRSCLKHGIKPIIGLEVTYQSTFDGQHTPLLLYAINNFGYQNLLKISSYLKINQQLTLEFIGKYAIGLLAVIPSQHYIFQENVDVALRYRHIKELQAYFSNLYLGLTSKNQEIWGILNETASTLNLEKVALHLTTYLHQEQLFPFQVLQAINKRAIDYSLDFQYLLTKNKWHEIFESEHAALKKTEEISNMCNVTMTFDQYQLPVYDESVDAAKFLTSLCYKGLKKRLTQNHLIAQSNEYVKRLENELMVIKKMGFCDYFLIVWDFIKYAKSHDILVGPGRGSAPASLVSYCLGITDIDPVRYHLLFERFLNSERVTMPDIDIDFPDVKRDQVIRYVGEKYGKERVAHIVTFGTFAARSAVRDVAKVLKLDVFKLEEVIKCLPVYTSKHLSDVISSSERLLQLTKINEDINKVLTIACCLEGLPRNTSTHAAGIVITKHPLVNYTALDNGLNDIYQTQYEASDLEALGLLKMDFLGLRNLTIIENCVALIKKDIPHFRLPTKYNDKDTFKMLAEGDTTGVFQLESAGMRKTLRQIQVNSFEDIASAIALYRPGPMDIIPTFIKRKMKKEKVSYPHPDLAKILQETYGTIVYQEQIMLIAWQFAGMSLGQADLLRRAITKKSQASLSQERQTFIDKCCEKGYEETIAIAVYDYIERFARYGFNKPHSIAYAVIAYLTAFLKQKYPGYYFATLMNKDMGADKSIKSYYQEALKQHIVFCHPHINISTDVFICHDNQIVFPLSCIKGLNTNKVLALLEIRKEKEFTDYRDFVKRTKDLLNEAMVNSLIYSGALDVFKITKKVMVENYRSLINALQYHFVETKNIDFDDSSELPFGILAEKEMAVLGFNLQYDLLKNYQKQFSSYHITAISQVQDKRRVNLLGTIKSIKEIKTTKNEKMAFMILEDQTGNISAVLFPRVYYMYEDLKRGNAIMCRGIVDKQRDELQLNVEEIIRCEELKCD